MTDDVTSTDPRAEIARLETLIDELTDTRERCRKMILAGKASIAIGALWIAVLALGPFKIGPLAALAAGIAIIGGIVVFGSNVSTGRQLDETIASAEHKRAELIGQIELRVVPPAGGPE